MGDIKDFQREIFDGLSSMDQESESLQHGRRNINVTFPGTVLPQEDGMPFHKPKKIKFCPQTNEKQKCFWFDVFYQDEDDHSISTNQVFKLKESEDFKFYAEDGTQMSDNDFEQWKEIKKLETDTLSPKSMNVTTMQILDPSRSYTELNSHIGNLVKTFDVIDLRPDEPETNYKKFIKIIQGLHVSKIRTVNNIIEPIYVAAQGIQWQLQSIFFVSNRVRSELEMLQTEIYRKKGCEDKYNLKKILQKEQPSVENCERVVASAACCLEARMVYTYTRHELNAEKHLILSRREQAETELQKLLILMEEI
jgi:hypothetical protein